MTFLKAIFIAFLGVGALNATASTGNNFCSPDIVTTHAVLNRALQNLRSLDYVLHALQETTRDLKSPVYCVSGLPLSQNAYLYYKFFIAIDVYESDEPLPRKQFRFLYQDASVQAHHNVGKKLWTGLDSQMTTQLIYNFLEKTEFKSFLTDQPPLTAEKALEIANTSELFKKFSTTINPSTVSVISLPQIEGTSAVYLVGFMTKASGNPFSNPVLSRGLILYQDEGGNIYASGEIWLSSQLLYPLEALLEKTRPDPSEPYDSVLLKISN